ncbi:MAG: lipid-binding SYLF domain-containing protein [Pseudomonadota bacterium]
MHTRTFNLPTLLAGCVLALLSVAGVSVAQTNTTAPATTKKEVTADKHVTDAVKVVQRMLEEPRMKELLAQAKGIFIVPTYGQVAVGVGASGGAGVLLTKRSDGSWGEPAFYNIGGISAGVQIGAEGGPIAMVLNNDKAVSKFMQKNAFALNAAAGLTLVNWSKIAQSGVGDGDVVVWSGAKGLYGSLVSVGVSDIRYSQKLTDAYYHQSVAIADALAGKYPNAQSESLRQTLAVAPR